MKYKSKSVIVGRKKRERYDDTSYPCFVCLFSMNNPHTSGMVPDKILDFRRIHKVIIKGLDINYVLAGNDLVINDLTELDITHVKDRVLVTGKQEKKH